MADASIHDKQQAVVHFLELSKALPPRGAPLEYANKVSATANSSSSL
jgi:hypothetical protein